MEAINPDTGERLETYEEDTKGDIEDVLRKASAIFTRWRDRSVSDTEFGLGASIWTEDRDRGDRAAKRIDAGCVYVNQLVKSDPRIPFGGVGDSGYGRELGEAGIKEFVNRKTVWLE
jgi:acyl-CoA reductase-like NAD-dependent aldehyde dehydrogenase